MTRTEAITEAVDEVYETLGIPRSKSRLKHHVQVRAAICVALTPFCTTMEIGEALGRDRSTCSYYTGKHNDNMRHWSGYAHVYDIVKDIVSEILEDYLLRTKVESLNLRIKTLKATRTRILRKLERDKVNETA